MNPFNASILENPAFWVFFVCMIILFIWGVIYLACHTVFMAMEPAYSMAEIGPVNHFGFKRISPDGSRYQWWVDGQWLEADEFMERCSGMGMSEDSVILEFGWDASTQRPKF